MSDRTAILAGFDTYQQAAMKTAIYKHPIFYPGFKLAGEAGEVSEKLGKQLRDADGDFTDPAFVEAIKKELGDVLWYVAALARDFGINLGDVALANIDKLANRQERGVLQGSGDNR